MIYSQPAPGDSLDQGDLIDECPLFAAAKFVVNDPDSTQVKITHQRVLIVTQTCDLANEKTTVVTVAAVFCAAQMVQDGTLKAADIKGPLRSGRVWGLYFLPA